jgi:D-alanine-D-alanine ligase
VGDPPRSVSIVVPGLLSVAMTGNRVRVAVVFGGRSSEHAISCVSAGSVLSHLDRDRFEVVPVGITTSGAWVLGTADPRELAITDRALPSVDATGTALALPGDPTRGGLVLIEQGRAGEVFSGVDVVFPVLHGPFGEDGTIQGLLEMAGLPYVGAGVLASAAGMDKEFTKKLLAAEGLPVGELVVLRPDTATLTDEQRARLGLPAFVKPARAGSSVGITRITSWDALDAAIATAREHDPKVLVEAAIVGREVECGVLEFPDGSVRASVPAEIRITGDAEFYDFESKYLDDVCEFDIPAKLDDAVSQRLQDMAVAAFRALDGQGLARVDFFVGPDGLLTVNEVNTMPGFTPVSMFPRVWEVTGLDYPTLLSTLVDTALARGTGLR